MALTEAAFGVAEGLIGDESEVAIGEGEELEDAGAADECGVDFEEGVFGGGADEGEGAVFDPGEEGVLLGFVEAVDFVDEEDGA